MGKGTMELRRILLPGGGDDLFPELDERLARLLPPILLGLALVSACLALAQASLPGSADDSGLLLSKVGASVVFLLARFALLRWSLPPGSAHLAGTVAGALALGVILHHIQLTGEPRETTFLLLLVLGAGLFYLDAAWFSLLVALALGGWIVIAGPAVAQPEWTFFGVALLVATVLSTVILVVRIRGARTLDDFRRQERVRQLELETALEQTERARQGEEEARMALEGALVQVKESEERFRRLADATFEGVVLFRDGRILDANSRAAEMFTVAVAQLTGDPVVNLVAPPDRAVAEPFLLADGSRGFVESLEVEGRRYDGTRFPMELSIVDSAMKGSPARVLVMRDVTNQKRVEGVLRRALEEAEANSRAKSTFLANMSHELRTPLNSVIGFANILRKKQEGRVEEREMDFLHRIVANGEHLLSLIEDILDLSKIDARRMELKMEDVRVEEVVDDVVATLELQARKKGLDVRTVLPGSMAPVHADRRRLKQVILNLASNAVKFTHSGWVAIRILEGEPGRPGRIEVADTGIGIPEDQLQKIFAPFHQVDASQTRAYGGTGLGLAISNSLCELMGFSLGAANREGGGSIFWVDLAARNADPTEPVSALEEAATSPRSGGLRGSPRL
jgi:PAS domain S-box-containing protein